ncbi:hypothetical protein ACHAWC_004205 [Mediolabrus comicus]
MWTFPINPQNTSSTTTNNDSSPSSSITIAEEVEPSACEKECSEQQRTLVACVDSIRAARLQSQQQADETQDDDDESSRGGDGGTTTTSTDTPECLPIAVAAWTKCCEEANLRERKMKEKEEKG